MKILKTLDKDEIEKVLNYDAISKFELTKLQNLINQNITIDYDRPLEFINHSEHGKDNIYAELEAYAKLQLNIDDASLFKLKGPLWHFSREIYQEWYLGSSLFKEVEDKLPISNFKKGFIYDEIILRPVEEIQTLLTDLQEAGYQLAIATGRPRTETMVPFKSLGLKQFFQDDYIVTATDVLNAEKAFPQYVPLGKPNPFCYIATLNGNDQSKYKDYVSKQTNIVNKEEVFIVGDSLADLLCAKKIGATFIGTLTGLKGQAAREELEDYEADYIVEHVSHIRDILI